MKQQINLYQAGVRRERPAFSALAMAASVVLSFVVLAGAWYVADSRAHTMTLQLQSIQQQETEAAERLAELSQIMAARDADGEGDGTLQAALKALGQRERLLELISGQGLGSDNGFSPALRALAQHNLTGLWLTRISVYAPGMRTTLEGRAATPDLVPEYLLGLSAAEGLRGQRFDQFEIERLNEQSKTNVRFSMTSVQAEQFAQRGATP